MTSSNLACPPIMEPLVAGVYNVHALAFDGCLGTKTCWAPGGRAILETADTRGTVSAQPDAAVVLDQIT